MYVALHDGQPDTMPTTRLSLSPYFSLLLLLPSTLGASLPVGGSFTSLILTIFLTVKNKECIPKKK